MMFVSISANALFLEGEASSSAQFSDPWSSRIRQLSKNVERSVSLRFSHVCRATPVDKSSGWLIESS